MVFALMGRVAALGSAAVAVPDGPGVAAAVALIGLLVVREIASALPAAQVVRWRRLLSVATLPLIVLFSLAVANKLGSMRTRAPLVSPPLQLQPVSPASVDRIHGSAVRVPAIAPLTIELGSQHGKPPALHPGRSARVEIGGPANTLVQVLLSFPGQQPISFYDPTDDRGRLSLELRVPQQFVSRVGRSDATIVAQIADPRAPQRVARVLHISALPG